MAQSSRLPSASAGGAKEAARAGNGATAFENSAHHREAHDLLHAPTGERVKAIIARCAARHGYTAEQLKAKGRSKPLVAARNEAIALVAKCFPDFSMPHIGKIFGGRDHTTILHALGRLGRQRGVSTQARTAAKKKGGGQ
jgi:chromosomal replication initiation ATPase DnaA